MNHSGAHLDGSSWFIHEYFINGADEASIAIGSANFVRLWRHLISDPRCVPTSVRTYQFLYVHSSQSKCAPFHFVSRARFRSSEGPVSSAPMDVLFGGCCPSLDGYSQPCRIICYISIVWLWKPFAMQVEPRQLSRFPREGVVMYFQWPVLLATGCDLSVHPVHSHTA